MGLEMADETKPKRRVGRPPTTANPDPMDMHVGSRVRLRRTLLGWSQEQLGDALNLTFQQIQKYERGSNRIGAGRLFELAKALGVSVSFFYEGLEDDSSGKGGKDAWDDMLGRRETVELVKAYYNIKDEETRQRVYDLARTLGSKGGKK